jgi:3-oxoacid CoA-transferase subunit B
MQVDVAGNLANWMVPGKKVTGMGGAMDLVNGAKHILVMMEHFDKKGACKLLPLCDLPLTGMHVVDTIVTNLGIFAPTGSTFRVEQLAEGVAHSDLGLDAALLTA